MQATGTQYTQRGPQSSGAPAVNGNSAPEALAHGRLRGDGGSSGRHEGGAGRESSGGLSGMDFHMDSLPSLGSLPRCGATAPTRSRPFRLFMPTLTLIDSLSNWTLMLALTPTLSPALP